MRAIVTLLAVSSLGLASCATLEESETFGMIAGGTLGALAVGALLADQSGTTTTVLGGLAAGFVGAWGGKKLARQVFEKDLAARDQAYRRAMSAYAQASWRNPDTRSTGVITPVSAMWREPNGVCGQFREAYNPAGEFYPSVVNTACLTNQGYIQLRPS